VRHHGDELILRAIGRFRLRAGRLLTLEEHAALGRRASARVVQRADEERDAHEDHQAGDDFVVDREHPPRRRHFGVERQRRQSGCQQPAAEAAVPGAHHHRRHEQRRIRGVGQRPDQHAGNARREYHDDGNGYARQPRCRAERRQTSGHSR